MNMLFELSQFLPNGVEVSIVEPVFRSLIVSLFDF